MKLLENCYWNVSAWKVFFFQIMVLLFLTSGMYGQNKIVDSLAFRQAFQQQLQERQMQASKSLATGEMGTMAAAALLPATYNYYVATTGSDANAGTQAAPLRSIQAAINKSVTGQAIKVAEGRYVERIDFMGKSIKVVGNPNNPASTIIDGNGHGSTVSMTSKETNTTLLCGFTITGGLRNGTGGGTYPDHGGGIFLYDNAKPLLSDLIITGNTANCASAIAVMHSSSPTIQNTVIYGNTNLTVQYTIRFHNYSGGGVLNNVTIADNAGAAAAIGVTLSSHITVTNCIIYNPLFQYEMYQSVPTGMSSAIVNYCNIRGGAGSLFINNKAGTYTTSNLLNVAPGFVNPISGRYQLSVGSPCIDAGNPTATWNDVNMPPSRGTVRNDLGAYGWQVSAQPYQTGGSSNRIQFVYDDSGNRKERNVIVLNSMMSQSAAYNASSNADESRLHEEPTAEVQEELLADLKITIYPNPTKGMLRVDISGSEVPAGARIYLYNLGGSLIKQWNGLSTSNTIDISAQVAGTYIMRVVLDKDQVSTWKIIKE